MRISLGCFGLMLAMTSITGCYSVNEATIPLPGSTSNPAKPQFYTGHVRPIFDKYCFRCHAGMNHRGDFSMDNRAAMMKGGKAGPDIIPGDPDASLMMKLLRHQGTAGDPENMPSKSARLADADIATIEQWIKAGALMPVDSPPPR